MILYGAVPPAVGGRAGFRAARGRELARKLFRYYVTNQTQEHAYRISDLEKAVMVDSKNGGLGEIHERLERGTDGFLLSYNSV